MCQARILYVHVLGEGRRKVLRALSARNLIFYINTRGDYEFDIIYSGIRDALKSFWGSSLCYFQQLKSVQVIFDCCVWNEQRMDRWASGLVDALESWTGYWGWREYFGKGQKSNGYCVRLVSSLWTWRGQGNKELKLVEGRQEIKKEIEEGFTGLDLTNNRIDSSGLGTSGYNSGMRTTLGPRHASVFLKSGG